MSAPTSSVEICQIALTKIMVDASTVHDIEFDPTSDQELLFATVYDQARRAVLRMHPWNFAIKRAILAASAVAPDFEYLYKFPLPSDFIRLASLGTYGDLTNYEFEDGSLLIDTAEYTTEDALPIRYVYDITNVNKFDPLFIDVLACRLALDVAAQMTGLSNTAIERANKFFKEAMQKAGIIDGQERPPRRIQRSKALASRYKKMSSGTNQKYYQF